MQFNKLGQHQNYDFAAKNAEVAKFPGPILFIHY